MSPLSLVTKLQTVWEFITSKNLYLMILAIIGFLTVIFITTNGSNRKQSRHTYIILYIALFIFAAIQYGNSFISLVDYAINEVFITYYFPNIVIYLIMLIITNIILWKTLFSNNIDKKLKIINSCVFSIIIYLFILAIAAITNLDLDVYNITELYSSNQVRSLLELSMFIFAFWIIILVIYHLIKKYQYKHNIIVEQEFTNYNIINNFDTNIPYKVVKKTMDIEPLEPKKEAKEPTEVIDLSKTFTLEEYKIMSQILKEEKAKQNKIQPETEENPLTELNKLYQSIKD